LIKIHREQRSDKKVKHELVRNSVLSAVRKTAPLFTAEEAKVTKIAEFRRLAEDMLTDGEYATTIEVLQEKAGDDEVDQNGKIIKRAEVQEYRVTKLKLDKDGNRVMTKKSALNRYGIKVLQFDIQNVKLDEKAQNQLDIVKEREMQRVANATAAETAKQKALTAEAEGKAKIAEAKAAQEVIKIAEVTQAEKERDVAILNAEREKEVARLEALKALEVAKKIKAEGEAEAAANRAKVAAGLTPQERAEWEYKTKVGVAEALAKSTHPLVPEIMMSGDSKGGAGNAMDAVGLNMLMDLTNKLSNK
jgi:regulator of protease activity HflC (stomatin/prohibitin superfamily)